MFADAGADGTLFSALKDALDPRIEVVTTDTHINDPRFALAMAERFDELCRPRSLTTET